MAGESCFSVSSYLLVLALEVVPYVLVLFLSATEYRRLVVPVALFLALLPLYRIGIANDLAMRASIPAIACLAVLTARVMIAGSRRASIAILVVFLFGVPAAVSGVYSAVRKSKPIKREVRFVDLDYMVAFQNQYFASDAIPVLRKGRCE